MDEEKIIALLIQNTPITLSDLEKLSGVSSDILGDLLSRLAEDHCVETVIGSSCCGGCHSGTCEKTPQMLTAYRWIGNDTVLDAEEEVSASPS